MSCNGKEILKEPNVEKFLSLVSINSKSECWEWRGSISNGYGAFEKLRAHRVAYHIFKGNLVYGLVVDHVCMNKKCVNPDHLRQVTQGENIQAYFKQKPPANHCKLGHEISGTNVYKVTIKNTVFYRCLKCKKRISKNHRERIKTAKGSTPTRTPKEFCLRGHEFTGIEKGKYRKCLICPKMKNSREGLPVGVSYNFYKYIAKIRRNGKHWKIGEFETAEQASAAYQREKLNKKAGIFR